jgi:DNA-binding transcriptional MocR family regulator
METAVTIPDSLFRQAEELAAALGISRNDLYAAALAEFIRDRRVTERLNEVYENNDSNLDAVIERLQEVSLPAERW